MEMEDLRAFVETVEAAGMTRAARRLGISKSVISRRLARLESELSGELIRRTTRGLSLTEAGAAFKIHAERILAEFDLGREAMRADGRVIGGSLRISASMSFGVTLLAPALAELALRHPTLQIHAHYTDRVVDLVGERFDAAIRLGVLPDSTMIAKRIAPMASMMVASSSYLDRHAPIMSPADLTEHAAVTLEGEVWRFRRKGRETTVSPKARFISDSGQALLAAAVAGVGVARLPAFLCGKAIATGQLIKVLDGYDFPEAGLFVVRPPPANHVPAKVRALIDFMSERFGGTPLWDQQSDT